MAEFVSKFVNFIDSKLVEVNIEEKYSTFHVLKLLISMLVKERQPEHKDDISLVLSVLKFAMLKNFNS